MRKPIAVLSCALLLLSGCGKSEPEQTSGSGAKDAYREKAVVHVPDDLGAYQFYIMPHAGGRPSDSVLSSGLWREQPVKWGNITLEAEKEYLVGVERRASSEDNAISDFSFTCPKGITLQSPVLRKSFSKKGSSLYHFGVFFPAAQADVVWDGVVRWVWGKGLRLEPLPGADSVAFASHAAKSEPFLQPLIPPIVRATEMEIQVVVEDHKATRIRKVFKLRGRDLKNTQFGMLTLNKTMQDQFPSRFRDVTSAEQALPDIGIALARGSTAKKDINFVNSESIWSSHMSCVTRHNAPKFLELTISFDGWNGATVKLSAEVKAKRGAPKGEQYFRMIHRGSWDKGIIYKERVVKVTIE